MGSKFFRLDWADVARGFVVAVATAVLTAIYGQIDPSGTFIDIGEVSWGKIGGIALAAGIAYLLKNVLSTADGKFAGKIGGFLLAVLLLVGLSACAGGGTSSGGSGPSTGGDQPPDPCAKADQILTIAGLGIATTQTGYSILIAAGTIKPGTGADVAISTSFDAANAALAKARVDRLAGRCDVTSAVMAVNEAMAKAAVDIAAARAAAQAAKDAEKRAKHDAAAASSPPAAAAKP